MDTTISGASSAQTMTSLVATSVLRLALDAEQSAAARLVDGLQPPALPTGGAGRHVDVYA